MELQKGMVDGTTAFHKMELRLISLPLNYNE